MQNKNLINKKYNLVLLLLSMAILNYTYINNTNNTKIIKVTNHESLNVKTEAFNYNKDKSFYENYALGIAHAMLNAKE